MAAVDPFVERLAIDVAQRMRDAVAPSLGDPAARERVGVAPGGDVTMAIDELAEHVLTTVCAEADDIAFYSEDQGYVEFGTPRAIFVVDPIDGTRAADAGIESCCISVAVVPASMAATLGDVQLGVVQEIKTGNRFVARRGGGVESAQPVRLSPNTDLRSLFWTAGLRGRPIMPVTVVLEELIDSSALRGGYFDLGSVTYNLTRIVTGQLDAYVDLGRYLVDVVPALEAEFRRVGEGAVCTNWPYDIAAAALVVQEAGGVVTWPDGASIAEHPAVGSGHGFGIAIVASATQTLHDLLLAALERGMGRLRAPGGDRFSGDLSVD